MTVHFIHIPKTGGTAIKRALRHTGCVYWYNWDPSRATRPTPYGRVCLHVHSFKFDDLPEDDLAFFCVRDPIDRFVSGFHSRLRRGQPRYTYEWSAGERKAFTRFTTPQALAAALGSADPEEREAAAAAMRAIRSIRPMVRSLAPPDRLAARLDQVLYIGRQETLAQDWENLRRMLALPDAAALPQGDKAAHRGPASDLELGDDARQALRRFYRKDYALLRFCEEVRRDRGWAPGTRSRPAVVRAARRLVSAPARFGRRRAG